MFISVDPNRYRGWMRVGVNEDVIRYNCGKRRIVERVGVINKADSSKLCPNHP